MILKNRGARNCVGDSNSYGYKPLSWFFAQPTARAPRPPPGLTVGRVANLLSFVVAGGLARRSKHAAATKGFLRWLLCPLLVLTLKRRCYHFPSISYWRLWNTWSAGMRCVCVGYERVLQHDVEPSDINVDVQNHLCRLQ